LPKSGGTLTPLATGNPSGVIWTLAGGYVVYATTETVAGPWDLWRVPVDGTGSAENIFQASAFTDLSSQGDKLYFHVDDIIASVGLDGTGFQYLNTFQGTSSIVPAADALYAMVSAPFPSLWALDYSTGQPHLVAQVAATASAHFAVNSTSAYWVEFDATAGKSHLMTVAKSGGTPTQLAVSTDDGMYDPVVNDAVVVWQEFLGGSEGTSVYELPAGGSEHALVPEGCQPADFSASIAIDSTNIYMGGMREDAPPIPTLVTGPL
jgi:hypothetical protein